MPSPENLEYLEIVDWTPGIWADTTAQNAAEPRGAVPDGAATKDNTYGCLGLPQGGLTGAPALKANSSTDATPIQSSGTAQYYSGGYVDAVFPFDAVWEPDVADAGTAADTRLLDFHVLPASQGLPFANIDSDDFPTARTQGSIFAALWTNWGTHDDTDGSGRTAPDGAPFSQSYGHCWYAEKSMYDGTGTTYSETNILRHVRPWFWDDSETLNDSQKLYGFSAITDGVYFDSNLTEWKSGVPVLYMLHHHTSESQEDTGDPNDASFYMMGNALEMWGGFSDKLKASTISTQASSTGPLGLAGVLSPKHIATHAARVIVTAGVGNGWGDYRGGTKTNVSVADSHNLWDTGSDTGTPNWGRLHYTYPGGEQAVDEFETGFTSGKVTLSLSEEGYIIPNSITAINANQMFITTTNKGAVVVDGDVSNPNIVNLPGVESTYGKTPHPVAINGGVVYGSRSGMFLWDGGEAAEPISPQLDGEFWMTDSMKTDYYYGAPVGRLAYRHPFVFAPSGWLYDMRTRAWWRIGDDTITHWRVDGDGLVHGMSAEENTLTAWPISTYDVNDVNGGWQWHSHPLSISRNRRIRVREIDLWANGNGFLYVGLWKEGSMVWNQVITLANDYPEPHTLTMDESGANFEIRIIAYSSDMTVHKMDIGYNQDSRIRPT